MSIARWQSAALTIFFLTSLTALAADHEDGPSVNDFPQADILDYFVFPSADGERLVLAMTLFSNAPDDAAFGEGISYRFRLRKGEIAAQGRGHMRQIRLSAGQQEDLITCQVATADSGGQTMRCQLNVASCDDNCLTAEATANTISDANPDGLRVFAGLVRDPFFSDVFRARRVRPRDRPMRFLRRAFNPFKGRNALAVVVEVPLEALKFDPGILATVAETTMSDSRQNAQASRIDRMGNVEITNFVLCFRPIEKAKLEIGFNQIEFPCPRKQIAVKDSYNSDDAFDVSAHHKALYRKWIAIGLKALDRIDSASDNGETEAFDWPHADEMDGTEHPFVDLFVESDWLMVDTGKACTTAKGASTYFDIQMSAYLGEVGTHTTCGGRTPNEDVIDKTLTLLANGPNRLPNGWWGSQSGGTIRADGVDQAGSVAPQEFPWLATQ